VRNRFEDLPIRRKFLYALLISTGAGFAVFLAVFAAVWLQQEHDERAVEVGTVAEVIARNSRAAVAFDDSRTRLEILRALEAMKAMLGGRIYSHDGTVLAEFQMPAKELPGAFSGPELEVIAAEQGTPKLQLHGALRILRPIVLDGETIGWVELDAEAAAIWKEVAQEFTVAFALALIACVLSLAFALHFRGILSGPIERLAAAADRVARDEEYAIPVEYAGRDELGTLVESFRRMLARIEQRTRELREAKELAVGASRAKSDFLASMSHEIRTPISAMMGSTEVLMEAQLPERERRMAEIAYRSGRTLLAVVDDVLDFSRIEAGKIDLASAPFDVETLAAGACETLAPRAEAKALKLAWSVAPEARGRYRGDASRLHQVLSNLLGNAVKYTDHGGIDLTVAIVDASDQRPRLHFEVKDTGIGIAAEAIGHLFEPFVQGGAPGSRGEGAGLGLAISRQLVELMGGNLGVESEPGKGTAFWFNVPLERLPPLDLAGEAPREDVRALRERLRERRLNVLLAEDHPAIAQVTVAMLELAGVKTRVVADGRTALDALREASYDAVLMNVRIPVLDGHRTLRLIRESEQGTSRHQVVVALTARVRSDERGRPLAQGFDGYLAKPVSQAPLLDLLARLCL
jgi:signal transduction histidine kinase